MKPFFLDDKSVSPVTPKKSPSRSGRPGILSQSAVEWLREYLKDGPKPAGNKNNPMSGTLYGDAIASGFKCSTVWRAAQILNVRKEKLENRWYWALPTENGPRSKQTL